MRSSFHLASGGLFGFVLLLLDWLVTGFGFGAGGFGAGAAAGFGAGTDAAGFGFGFSASSLAAAAGAAATGAGLFNFSSVPLSSPRPLVPLQLPEQRYS